MNIQIYSAKKNFDCQKAERYFKERRVPFVSVDLKKHKLGSRELALFARAAGSMRKLIDPDAKGEKADYVRQLSIDSVIEQTLLDTPSLILSPIVRNGNSVTLGFKPEIWETWL